MDELRTLPRKLTIGIATSLLIGLVLTSTCIVVNELFQVSVVIDKEPARFQLLESDEIVFLVLSAIPYYNSEHYVEIRGPGGKEFHRSVGSGFWSDHFAVSKIAIVDNDAPGTVLLHVPVRAERQAEWLDWLAHLRRKYGSAWLCCSFSNVNGEMITLPIAQRADDALLILVEDVQTANDIVRRLSDTESAKSGAETGQ